MSKVQWKPVRWHGNKLIGAAGIIDGKVALLASFYADNDGNMDGKVTLTEKAVSILSPIRLSGSTIARVAVQAAADPDILESDPEFRKVANNIYLNFARQAVFDGIYAVYISMGVSSTANAFAKEITASSVKQILIRKGFESSVKGAFRSATSI